MFRPQVARARLGQYEILCTESVSTIPFLASSVQSRVLFAGFGQQSQVGVGVLPEREEILVSLLGFGGVAGEYGGARQADVGQRIERPPVGAFVVEHFLELGRGFRAT